MSTFLITCALLGLGLLWLRSWMGHSRLALGIAIGFALATVGGPLVKALTTMEQLPIWLPALPFAVIATTLFGFGLLAWFWAED